MSVQPRSSTRKKTMLGGGLLSFAAIVAGKKKARTAMARTLNYS